ncbi:glycosyltransferase [Ruania albidiflava]|uniref:glycosyltransferase n=1 Tax=Ruania albidiflava TaxID=366586 RepID=UPI0003B300E4|nr:glycosyltransferase [Ruania albidiflava]
MTEPQLPRIRGRAPRVLSLVYNDASNDSRVLKTAASLQQAGAQVQILGSARDLAGHPAGVVQVRGLRVRRVPDLIVPLVFPRLTRLWRRLAGKDPVTGQRAAADDGATAGARSVTGPGAQVGERAPAAPSAAARAKVFAADAWMRLYQTCRLGFWWKGAVGEGRRLRPDVVHANDANALVPALLIAAGRRTRIVYDSHELWRRRNTRQDKWLAPAAEAVIERIGIRRAAGVITVSPSIADWLQHTYRLTEKPSLVRNIPAATVVPDPARGRLRELTGLRREDKIIAYTGGVTTGRGLEETVDAVAHLPRDVHLVLLGPTDATYTAGLLHRADAAGVGDRVHLAGVVPYPEVPQALADADVAVVFVRPICLSYTYSLPNKLFESIHAGLPIVAADLPDTAEIVRRYGIGEVFAPERPDELAASITHILTGAQGYRAASRRAAAELTWEHEAGVLVDLYRRALEELR